MVVQTSPKPAGKCQPLATKRFYFWILPRDEREEAGQNCPAAVQLQVGGMRRREGADTERRGIESRPVSVRDSSMNRVIPESATGLAC